MLLASMRLENSLNADQHSDFVVSIRLGIDYTMHFVHRFVDEYEDRETFDVLAATVARTGGALTGSMITTVSGSG